MPPHVAIAFEIERHYQNKTRFNSVHSKNNLLTIKNTAYLINLDEFLILQLTVLLVMFKMMKYCILLVLVSKVFQK